MLERPRTLVERLAFWRGLGAAPAGLAPGQRDERLDMFRGLALVMIFINHVPGTAYEMFTNRNFGFSDAAEAFVFMSGMAAGLAYSGAFAPGKPFWLAAARPLARARQLYFVHLTITLLCLGIFAAAAHLFGLYEVLGKNNIAPIFRDPLAAMMGIPLLTHQLGYLNILPLYLTLLLFVPLIIPLGLRWPHAVALGAVVIWALAGQFRLNFPNYPNSGGWFFNPISWQLLFVLGLLCGMAMKRGGRFVPFHPVAFALAAAYLVLVLVWVKVPQAGAAGREVLGALSRMGLPFYLTWFDKTFLALPRLSHALALFYVLASLPFVQRLAASRAAAPLRLMGRQGLAVFATGTVISMALQVVKTVVPPHPVSDGLLLGGGLLILLALAWALTATTDLRRRSAKPTPP